MLRSSTEASGTKNAAEAASPQGSTVGGRRNPDERGIHSYIAMTIPQDEKKVRRRNERAPPMPMVAVEREGFPPSRLAEDGGKHGRLRHHPLVFCGRLEIDARQTHISQSPDHQSGTDVSPTRSTGSASRQTPQ